VLRNRYGLKGATADTLAQVIKLFAPTGFLMLRTAAITVTYAVATSLAAQAGPAAAACHQVCFQLWLASSLLADSLAVASQTMLATRIAAKDTSASEVVIKRTVTLAAALGVGLAVLMGAFSGSIPSLFTGDSGVLGLIAVTIPWVVLTQPINALAFVADGVLYGAGGFRYASIQMACCALPAVGLMTYGCQLAAAAAAPAAVAPQVQLAWVWAGLTLVMALRAVTIGLPYIFKLPPFKEKLWVAASMRAE